MNPVPQFLNYSARYSWGGSGTIALLLVAIIFDYSSASRALLVGLPTTIVWYVFDPRLLANAD